MSLEEANRLFRDGAYGEAYTAYRALLDQRPELAELISVNLRLVMNRLAESGEAALPFEQSPRDMVQCPDYVEEVSSIDEVGDVASAISVFEESFGRYPCSRKIVVRLGDAVVRAGYAPALTDILERVGSDGGEDAEMRFLRITSLLSDFLNGNHVVARKLVDDCLKEDDRSLKALLLLP